MVPAIALNVIAAPIRPNEERLETIDEASSASGLELQTIHGATVYRRRWWDFEDSKANAAVFLLADGRPSITIDPAYADRFYLTAPKGSFRNIWTNATSLSQEVKDYGTSIHELLHLGALFGFIAEDENGNKFLVGGQGIIPHHVGYLIEADKDKKSRNGERVERLYSCYYKNGKRKDQPCHLL